jgi:FtsP/CotA-like multicopper oxidase with cupredoxin domain
MDGVSGLTQPPIKPGETFVYEFTLVQHGTHMYHPHADEMVQMAMGMMGMFIIHPKEQTTPAVDRDYAVLLHNWAVHPGTYKPDPSVMSEFDLWTMNSKVFPAIESMVAQTGERVRIRVGNLSMWNHPIHLHGVQFELTGSDGGRWPQTQWRKEVTEIVGVGQTRDLEFIAVPGDWAFHCHMSHHTMNAMGHGVPNMLGAQQPEAQINKVLPGYMAMGESGMAEHQVHTDMGHMPGPENTLPMMMGDMFSMIRVRDQLGSVADLYEAPEGTQAKKVSAVPAGIPV